MKRLYTCRALVVCSLLAAGCSESSFNPQDPATMEPTGTLPTTRTAGESVTPAVIVRDAAGQPVGGVTVTFQVTGGGGTVSSATAVTTGNGIASSPWTLGPSPVTNTLVATAPSLDPVSFSVDGCREFCIDIRYVGDVTAAQRDAFTNARMRWESVITGDLPGVQMTIGAGACKDAEGETLVDHPAISELVDDLLVYVQVDSIDGVNGVLGSAGPCFIRNSSRLPIFGIMRFDRADLAAMNANGLLGDVILHELGHVLGFPTIWEDPAYQLLVDAGSNDPHFTGANALSAFQLAGGTPVNGVGVPVENAGGEGTRDSHWREAVMTNELMTGFVSAGSNPLSAITIGSFADIGYVVNYSAADDYSLSSGGSSGWRSVRLEMMERPMPKPRVLHQEPAEAEGASLP